MAGVLEDLASAPLPAVGPRKTFVLDVRPDMLEIRASTVEDTVFSTTPLRKLAWDSIRTSLADGRRTALILLCALAGPSATSEARLRDVASDRLAFGRRVQAALAPILDSCSAAACQNTRWQGAVTDSTAVGNARKCVLACDMGGALLSTVSALVDRTVSWDVRERPVACIDGPLSASRALPGAWAVLPHRPQPRLPRFDRNAASPAVSVIVAVFPDELVAHVSTDSDMSTSSDLSDTPDSRTPQLSDEQRTIIAKGFAWRVGEWAKRSGVQVVFTAQELVEEVLLHAHPSLRIVDGVDRRQLYQLTRRLAGGGGASGDRDRVRAAVESFSMTGAPAGWCDASAGAVLRAILHSETAGLVSVTPEERSAAAADGGAVLISAPAHAVAKRGLECFQKASKCLENPAATRVVPAAGWEVLLCFAAHVAEDGAIDADVRNWIAAAMRACATTLIARTYSVTTRVAAGIAAGGKAPLPFPDEPEPFESIEHMLRVVSCSVEIACALLRVEP